MAAPISAEYVVGLHRHATSMPEERGLRSFITEVRRLFDMRHPVRIPAEYKAIATEVRTPFLRDDALRITASLTKDSPLLSVTPRGDDEDSKLAAAIAARWSMAQNVEKNLLLGGEDVIYQSALALVRDSESVIKTVHRPQAWANFPVREEGEPPRRYLARAEKHAKGGVVAPFAWRSVDRLQMCFGDGEYGDEWAIEYGEYPLPYLDRRYQRDAENPTPETTLGGTPSPEAGAGIGSNTPIPTYGSGPAGRTLKLEYFDATTWAVVINGKMAPGFPKKNPYAPLLPYHRAVSYPALYALRYLVPAIDACLTMKMNWAYLSAFPVVVMEPLSGVSQMLQSLPTGDTGEPPAQMTWKPGKIYFPPAGYGMKFLEPPATGADLNQMISELRELIDVAGVPNVFRGIGGSRQAGYAINQLMAAAQLTYRQLGSACERQQESIARFDWHAVEYTIEQPVYVLGDEGDQKMWLGLKPTGAVQKQVAPVDELGPPRCTFRPILPTDEQSEAMIALQVVNAPKPLASREYAMAHYMHIDDPQGMVDDIDVEGMLNSEPLLSETIDEGRRLAGLPVRPPARPPGGAVGSAQPGDMLHPNDQTNAGEPTVPMLSQPLVPNAGMIPAIVPGGRPAGMNPGEPAVR